MARARTYFVNVMVDVFASDNWGNGVCLLGTALGTGVLEL